MKLIDMVSFMCYLISFLRCRFYYPFQREVGDQATAQVNSSGGEDAMSPPPLDMIDMVIQPPRTIGGEELDDDQALLSDAGGESEVNGGSSVPYDVRQDRPLVPTGKDLPVFVKAEGLGGVHLLELPGDARISDLRQAAIDAGIQQAEHGLLSCLGKELDDEQAFLCDVAVCAESVVYITKQRGIPVYIMGFTLMPSETKESRILVPAFRKLIHIGASEIFTDFTPILPRHEEELGQQLLSMSESFADEGDVILRLFSSFSYDLHQVLQSVERSINQPHDWTKVQKLLAQGRFWFVDMMGKGNVWVKLDIVRDEMRKNGMMERA